jgi:hypothetical protein
VVKTNRSGLVKIVQDLAVEAVAVNCDGGKKALIQQRANNASHIILGSFQGQENGRSFRVRKPGEVGSQRPKEIHHSPSQPSYGDKADLPTRTEIGGAQRGLIGLLESALRGDDEDRISRQSSYQEILKVFHADGGFTATGRTGEEDTGVERSTGDKALFFSQIHRLRVAESKAFVNQETWKGDFVTVIDSDFLWYHSE